MSKSDELPQWPETRVEPFLEQRDAMRRLRDVVPGPRGERLRVPRLPYETWCKPSGNVTNLVVMNTRNIKEAVDPQRYANYVRSRALKDGWFPWLFNDCKAYAPWLLAQHGVTTEEQWHTKREELRLERKKAYEDGARTYNAAWADQESKMAAKTQEALQAAFQGALEQMKASKGKNG